MSFLDRHYLAQYHQTVDLYFDILVKGTYSDRANFMSSAHNASLKFSLCQQILEGQVDSCQ